MAFKDELSALINQLADAGVKSADVLAAAGVHRTTWMRWQDRGVVPSVDQWADFQAIARRMIEERPTVRQDAAA